MANFVYTGINPSVRNQEFENRLEKISPEEAAIIAGLASVPDTGADGDFDVTTNSMYNELYAQAKGFWKKLK